MLVKVDHLTVCRYDRPVRGVVQRHRLTPSRFDGQSTANWSVTVTDGTRCKRGVRSFARRSRPVCTSVSTKTASPFLTA